MPVRKSLDVAERLGGGGMEDGSVEKFVGGNTKVNASTAV